MMTRKKIRLELDRVARLVEAAWKRHERKKGYGEHPFICPGIGVVGRCSDSAVYLAARLGGAVYGYTIEDNPTATVGEAEGGHDFAVIADRWLADFWAKDTYQLPDLYDMQDPGELKQVLVRYGDQAKWQRMSEKNFEHNKENMRDLR